MGGAVLSVAVLSLLLLLPTPSWAGRWVIVLNGTGTSTSSSGTLTCTIKDSVVTNGASLGPYAPPLASMGSSGIGMGNMYTPYSGSPTFTVIAKLIWTPDYPQDPSLPPPTVDVLETGVASCAQYLVNPTGVKSVADDGLQDTPVPEVAPMYGQKSTGCHLVHLTVPAGQKFVMLPSARTLSASISFATAQGSTGPGTGISYGVQIDNRYVLLRRDGAHGETQDANGTIHGDTTYSYLANAPLGLGSTIVQSMQVFHPYFAGPWSSNPKYTAGGTEPALNISYKWNPQNLSLMLGPVDTWSSHSQKIDTGSAYLEGTPSQWYGPTDAVKVLGISYTATDLGSNPNATAVGNYILSVHDQYDNWRVVDAQGKPTAKGTPGPIKQLATGTTPVPAGAIAVSLPDTGVNWALAGINGGGAVGAAGVIVSVAGKSPTWVGAALGLAGLAMQTAGSQPTDPSLTNSPDQMSQSFLQSAYGSYTALPGQQIGDNSVDTKLYNFISSQIKTPQDWSDLYNGLFTQVSVTATVSLRTLNFNFYANQYDTGGLVTTTYPGSVTGVPGGPLWSYLWTYAGIPVKPASPSIMPSA